MLNFIKIFILVLVACCILQGYANAQSFDYIDIKPEQVITNSNAKVSKKIISDNKIILNFKKVKPSQNFKVIYNTTNLDNIIVKETGKNTKIIIKAPNASNIRIHGQNESQTPLNYFWLLGLGIVIFLIKPKNETQPILTNKQYVHNIDHILKNKIKRNEEKIKIAA